MGCDIHVYTETLDKNGDWLADARGTYDVESFPDEEYAYYSMDETFTGRDYILFGVLAGVRRHYPFSFDPKGFPEDASSHVNEIYQSEIEDAHTPSYLSKEELQTKATELLITGEHIPPEVSGCLKTVLEKLNGEPDKQRIVFWFDN